MKIKKAESLEGGPLRNEFLRLKIREQLNRIYGNHSMAIWQLVFQLISTMDKSVLIEGYTFFAGQFGVHGLFIIESMVSLASLYVALSIRL